MTEFAPLDMHEVEAEVARIQGDDGEGAYWGVWYNPEADDYRARRRCWDGRVLVMNLKQALHLGMALTSIHDRPWDGLYLTWESSGMHFALERYQGEVLLYLDTYLVERDNYDILVHTGGRPRVGRVEYRVEQPDDLRLMLHLDALQDAVVAASMADFDMWPSDDDDHPDEYT